MRNKIFSVMPFLLVMLTATVVSAESSASFEDAMAAYKNHDCKQAITILLKLAKQGNAKAQGELGALYYAGDIMSDKCVKQNSIEAVKWLRKAAEQGDATSQHLLGTVYDNDLLEVIPRDYREGAKLYRMAAEQENYLAQYALGEYYKLGKSVKQNKVLADMWFNLAVRQIDESTWNRNKANIEAEMTPQQIDEAQRLASEWLQQHNTQH